MVSPPVHRPSDPDYGRRVGWGLALVTLGLLAPLLYARAAGPSVLWAPSLYCAAADCPTLAQWSAYLLSIPVTLGVTVCWWSGRARSHALVGAQSCAMAALVGWAFVVPASPWAWIALVPGGFLVASGTCGLFERRSHDREGLPSRLATVGGVSVFAGFAATALLGYWSLAALPFFAVALGAYLLLVRAPLGWLRAHAVWFLAAALLAVPPWSYVRPESIGVTDMVPPPESLPPQPPDGSPVFLADEVITAFVLVGVAAMVLAAAAALVWSLTDEAPGPSGLAADAAE
ncbi:hypothetical protein C475_08481 [Halosimplex carlsbadense 2-9-1]|uniref:Uncharacterized protein n=1 Tax=Halosimplex carlsbadense 2-9-1 TaxID=797114 RepID=M0CWZ6_9EURY|nr:hypothetical protein [Halosimplex carlsbadense]ELZ26957.1 hypothetical protein C475_08481 [Halosimplex carlsbadense 2-9-1]